MDPGFEPLIQTLTCHVRSSDLNLNISVLMTFIDSTLSAYLMYPLHNAVAYKAYPAALWDPTQTKKREN